MTFKKRLKCFKQALSNINMVNWWIYFLAKLFQKQLFFKILY